MGDGALRLSPPASEFWVDREFFFFFFLRGAGGSLFLRFGRECMRVGKVSLILFLICVLSGARLLLCSFLMI